MADVMVAHNSPTRSLGGFGDLPKEGFARLVAAGEMRRFTTGTDLMRQGDPSKVMHVILAGRVRVTRMDPRVTKPIELAILGPGQVVGEMGVLDGGPRSATVTAVEDTTTAEVTAAALARIVIHDPEIYGSLLRLLSRRLRSTDELALCPDFKVDG